ncbi:UbiA prenyltransferase family-domain-containing protein [Pyronema domesticum]|uniref:4-hydroxybenzoate polyprenyltransferase, mitochondrial n=1 Tax=Pyronema omphalodes (strain CBS 100304) TaxID=1076935 RepID=U4LM87_PYROM|nr:UbiA prenyltransferase family-domain-containing protein [Pyronema domesticum]CCX30450.1 Similar to 4-hydroxybenzoate polyprenyltransferase, mitochondrial; acc. no. P32378 [Pyronema omphalodes CBS 100304]
MLLFRRPTQLTKSIGTRSLSSQCLTKLRPLVHRSTSLSFRRPTALAIYRAAATLTPANGADSSPKTPDVYTLPTTGFISWLPKSWLPYAELTRLDKPTGTIYLLLPCLWSTVMAASLTTPIAPVSSVLYTSFLFTTGAFIMRGAGCTINDLWDRNIDPKVTRTKFRPLARRAVTPQNAFLFAGAQCLTGLGLLVQFPVEVIFTAIPSMLVVCTYPAMKRFTNYPQVVLGTAFSWGALLGFPAMGLSLLDPVIGATAACLYASNVAWTVLYDTVYAHQDIKDDKKAGVKSTAIANEGRTRIFLSALGVVQIGLLAGAGVISGMGPAYFVGSCGGTAVGLGWMIARANFKKVGDCWWWFKWCAWSVGGVAIGGGLVAEYAVRKANEEPQTLEA